MSRIVVDELVTLIGAEVDKAAPVNVEKFKGQLLVLSAAAMDVAQKIWSFGQSLSATVQKSGAAAMSVEQLSKRTNLSTAAIQEMGYAVTKTGGSVSALMSDLDHLNKIRGTTPLNQMLDKLSNDFSKSTQLGAVYLAEMWQISLDSARMFQQGKMGLEDLFAEARKSGAIIPEDLLHRTTEWNEKLLVAKLRWDQLTDKIKMETLPFITKMYEKLSDFLQQHGEAWGRTLITMLEGVGSGFKDLGVALGKVWEHIPGHEKMSAFFSDSQNLKSLFHDLTEGGIPALGLALLVLKGRWVLLGLEVAALVLVVTEFFNLIQGKQNLFEDLLNRGDKFLMRLLGINPEEYANATNAPDAGKYNQGKAYVTPYTRDAELKALGNRPSRWDYGFLNAGFWQSGAKLGQEQQQWDKTFNWINRRVPVSASGPSQNAAAITQPSHVTIQVQGGANAYQDGVNAGRGFTDYLDKHAAGVNAPLTR